MRFRFVNVFFICMLILGTIGTSGVESIAYAIATEKQDDTTGLEAHKAELNQNQLTTTSEVLESSEINENATTKSTDEPKETDRETGQSNISKETTEEAKKQNNSVTARSNSPTVPMWQAIPVDETHFPDPHFREYITKTYGTTLSTSTRSYTTVINIQNNEFKDISGIEYFYNAYRIVLTNNKNLKEVDATSFNKLAELTISGSPLESIQLPSSKTLQRLFLIKTALTEIDLAPLSDLTTLELSGSPISEIKLNDKNDKLATLAIGNSNLSISQLRLDSMPNLATLRSWSNNFPTVDLSNNPLLKYVDLAGSNVSQIDLSNNLALYYLNLSKNALKSVDTSKNVDLKTVYLYENPLQSVDVKENKELDLLSLGNTELTTVDISQNVKLTSFSAYKNHLSYLDLSKNNNLTLGKTGFEKQTISRGAELKNDKWTVSLGIPEEYSSNVTSADPDWIYDEVEQTFTYQKSPETQPTQLIYKFDTQAPVKLNNNSMDVTAALTYEPLVVAEYIDEEGNEIADRTFLSGDAGSTYQTDKKVIADYSLKEVIGEAKGIFTNEIQRVKYVYTKNPEKGGDIIIHYQDLEGNTIVEDEQLSGNVGDPYRIEQKNITNYTFVKVEGDTSGTFTSEVQEITYIYRKNVANLGKVIVHYQDLEGKKLANDETLSGNIYENYVTEKKAIKGYVFKEVKGKEAGIYTLETQEVTYVYSKQVPSRSSVLISYENEAQEKLANDITLIGNIGDDYTGIRQDIPGYTLKRVEGNEKGNYTPDVQRIVYVYEVTPSFVSRTLANTGTTPTHTVLNNTATVTPTRTTSRQLPQTGENEEITLLLLLLVLSKIALLAFELLKYKGQKS